MNNPIEERGLPSRPSLEGLTLEEQANVLFGSFIPSRIDSTMSNDQVAVLTKLKAKKQQAKSAEHAWKEKALFAFYGASIENQKIVREWLKANGMQDITTGNL